MTWISQRQLSDHQFRVSTGRSWPVASGNDRCLAAGPAVRLRNLTLRGLTVFVNGLEKLVGDMDRPGQPFVIRIHHDAGYVVLPHTHPEDENITVLTGNWALGMGSRVNIAELEPMEQGALGFVPKRWRTSDTRKSRLCFRFTGIGPFVNLPIDPVFELTSKGVLSKPLLLKPGVPLSSSPPDCFKLKIGAHMQGDRGGGVVVGGLCSPHKVSSTQTIEW
jgi:hypothetical protein